MDALNAVEPEPETSKTTQNSALPQHIDVLIAGAGLSGIGAAYHLQTNCPGKSYRIVESRETIGGTWDLFRYPGIRSDSDMFTLGYKFKPWNKKKSLADGPSILRYIKETAAEFDIKKNIHYGHKVMSASWSTSRALWTVKLLRSDGHIMTVTCNYLYMCTGYYDYNKAYTPEWPGMEHFKGQIIHPQFWPEDLDYTGKKVVVIGSGATAITLVPAMADKTKHITMLQRSPTYVISTPSQSWFATISGKILPRHWAYKLSRSVFIYLSSYFYKISRNEPDRVKLEILRRIRTELGPEFDIERHFFPYYNPWDQRMCLIPDNDLFIKMREGKASVVTDVIETFTENGVKLKSGKNLEADIIVTATGLKLKALGGIKAFVDGMPVSWGKSFIYKGCMFSDIPNLVMATGYTNASWTLKTDLSAEYFCRLINYMDAHKYEKCTPRIGNMELKPEPAFDLKSGYIVRAYSTTPKQGDKAPWKVDQNYYKDKYTYTKTDLDDGVMEFKNA